MAAWRTGPDCRLRSLPISPQSRLMTDGNRTLIQEPAGLRMQTAKIDILLAAASLSGIKATNLSSKMAEGFLDAFYPFSSTVSI